MSDRQTIYNMIFSTRKRIDRNELRLWAEGEGKEFCNAAVTEAIGDPRGAWPAICFLIVIPPPEDLLGETDPWSALATLRAFDEVFKSLGGSPFYRRVEEQLSEDYGGAVSTSLTDKAKKFWEAREMGKTYEEAAHHVEGLAKSACCSRAFGDLDEGIFA